MHRTSKGFTLIDLVVVIAIITVLVAFSSPAFASARPRPHLSPPSVSQSLGLGKETTARSLPVTNEMEVLYRRDSEFWKNQWQLCLLHLPSGKVEVLLDRKKNRKQLGAVLGHALFSPDGKLVLFAASDSKSPSGVTGEYTYGNDELLDLWLYNRRTKGMRRLTTDRQGYHLRQWSPDGQYVSAHGSRRWTSLGSPRMGAERPYYDLYVWNARTGRRRLVLEDVMREQWSPDSRRLLALRNDWLLYEWDARTGKKRLVTTDVRDVVWMRNSKGFLYVKTPPDGWWYVPAAGGPATVFLKSPKELADSADPVLSPDGKRLVYRNSDDDTRVLTLATGESRPEESRFPLANTPGPMPDTRWSPDSTKIAQVADSMYHANEAPGIPLIILDAQTGKSIIQKTFEDKAELMGWSRDSKTIFVGSSTYLEKTNADGFPFRFTHVHVIAVSTDTSSRDLGILPTKGALRDAMYLDWRLVCP